MSDGLPINELDQIDIDGLIQSVQGKKNEATEDTFIIPEVERAKKESANTQAMLNAWAARITADHKRNVELEAEAEIEKATAAIKAAAAAKLHLETAQDTAYRSLLKEIFSQR